MSRVFIRFPMAARDASVTQQHREPLLVAKQWSGMKALAGVLFLFAFVQVVLAAPQNGRCDLPQGLQREITTKYPGRKLVTISDLQEDDRAFFQKDHGDSCPGLVQVDFYGDGKPTFAMVLLTKDNSELVVAHRVGETWRSTVLGTGGPNAPVMWSLPPGEYTSVDGDKKIRATKSVIVFVQYEAAAQLEAMNRVMKLLMLGGQSDAGKTYAYDAQGRLTEMRSRNFGFDEVKTISYNEHGDKSAEHATMTSNLSAPANMAFSMDENGTIIPGGRTTEPTESPALSRENEVLYEYEYDSYGNWTQLTQSHSYGPDSPYNIHHRKLTYY